MCPKDLAPYFTDPCSTMFIAALFPIARKWRQAKCPSPDEWIMETWCIYTMKYYLAIKKNHIMKTANKWEELEKIIMNEVTQTRKANTHVLFHLCFLAPNP